MKEKWQLPSIEYWYDDLKAFFRRNGNAFWKEVIQTQELVIILARMAALQKVSSEEKKMAIKQFKDLGKMGFAFSIFMVPGGTILLPLVAKLLPWDLLPDSFKEQVKDEVNVNDDFFFRTEEERLKEIKKELGVNVERKRIYNLISDFKIARKKYKKLKNFEAISDFYILPNYHHFALLSKNLSLSEEHWNEAIDHFQWKPMKEMMDYIDGNLLRRSYDREALVLLEHFEELIKHPIPIEIALIISFNIFKKSFIFNQNTCIIYFSLDVLWKNGHDIKDFRIEVTRTIAKLIRFVLHLNTVNTEDINFRDEYKNLLPVEKFINLIVSYVFLEKMCHGIKDYELLEIENDKYKSLILTYKSAIEPLKAKLKETEIWHFLPVERYIALVISQKLAKKFSYNEIIHLPEYLILDYLESV